MARYIDIDREIRLMKEAMRDKDETAFSNYIFKVLIEELKKAPTADVVEVVRCKDCRYGEIDDADFPDQYLCHYSGCDWNDGNHFCANGVSKERGGEK